MAAAAVDISDLPAPPDISDLPAPPPPDQTVAGAVQAAGSGLTSGIISDIAGMPVDKAREVLEMGKAAAGVAAGEATKKEVSPEPSMRTTHGLYHYIDPNTGADTYSKTPPPAGAKPYTHTQVTVPSFLQPFEGTDIGSSENIKGGIEKVLGKNATETQQDTGLNRVLHAAGKAVPANILFGAEAPIANALAGAAGGAASQGVAEAGGTPLEQAAAGLAAGTAPAVLPAVGAAALRGAVRGTSGAAMADRAAQAAESGQNLSAGAASGNSTLQYLEGALGKLWGGGAIGENAEKNTAAAGAHVNKIVDNLSGGQVVSPQVAGSAIEAGIGAPHKEGTAMGNMRKEEEAKYDKIDQLVDPNTPVTLTATKAAVNDALQNALVPSPKIAAVGSRIDKATAAAENAPKAPPAVVDRPEPASANVPAAPEPSSESPNKVSDENTTLYHGSAADFDKFDLGQEGSGYGGGAFGRGVYLGDSKKVADHYVARMNDQGKTGVSYTVQVPKSVTDTFADWSKPIGEQNLPAPVKKVLLDVAKENIAPKVARGELKYTDVGQDKVPYTPEGETFGGVYRNFVQRMGGRQAANDFLTQNGVLGHTFGSYENGSRGRNYVVYDPKNITITAKNGKPVANAPEPSSESPAIVKNVEALANHPVSRLNDGLQKTGLFQQLADIKANGGFASTHDVLDHMVNVATEQANPHMVGLLSHIRDHVPDLPIRPVDTVVKPLNGEAYGNTTTGLFDPNTHTIQVKTTPAAAADVSPFATTHTLVHEIMHGATQYELDNNPNGKFANAINDALLEARARATKMGLDTDKLYGLKNAKELVAETHSNPQFVQFLHDSEAHATTPKNTGALAPIKNLYDRIAVATAKLFGAKTPQETSLLRDIMSATQEGISMQKSKRLAPEGSAANIAKDLTPEQLARLQPNVALKPSNEFMPGLDEALSQNKESPNQIGITGKATGAKAEPTVPGTEKPATDLRKPEPVTNPRAMTPAEAQAMRAMGVTAPAEPVQTVGPGWRAPATDLRRPAPPTGAAATPEDLRAMQALGVRQPTPAAAPAGGDFPATDLRKPEPPTGAPATPEDQRMMGSVANAPAPPQLPQTVRYGDLAGLKKSVGNNVDWGHAPANPEENGQLKRLHGAIKQDMNAAASQVPGGAEAVADANQTFAKNEQRREVLRKVVNAQGGPEGIFKAATSGTKDGPTKIGTVMGALDEGQKNLVRATVINRLGHAAKAVGRDFDSSIFLTNWKTMEPAAKDALFGASGESAGLRRGLDSLTNTLDTLKNSTKLANHSGTGAAVGHGGGLLAAWEGVSHALQGNVAPLAGVVGGVAANKLLSSALVNPRVVKWLAATTKLPSAGIPNAVLQLQKLGEAANDPDAKALANYLQGAQ